MEDDADLELNDEMAALQAIYGSDVTWDPTSRACEVHIPDAAACSCLLRVYVPAGYPSRLGPVAELEVPESSRLPLAALEATVAQLEQDYAPGEVVLFQWIEAVRDQVQQLSSLTPPDDRSSGGGGSAEATQLTDHLAALQVHQQHHHGRHRQAGDDACDQVGRSGASVGQQHDAELLDALRSRVVSGEPHTVNRSTFQAHVAPVSSVAEVEALMAVLIENKKIQAATHNILAYRFAAQDKPGCYQQDYDDDGETAAGGRLLHMLQAADVSGVAVVVSRWFGGVLLGPARFGLINNTARDLLTACGHIDAARHGQQGAKAAHGHGKGKKQ